MASTLESQPPTEAPTEAGLDSLEARCALTPFQKSL